MFFNKIIFRYKCQVTSAYDVCFLVIKEVINAVLAQGLFKAFYKGF
jgi:hypothetical protein